MGSDFFTVTIMKFKRFLDVEMEKRKERVGEVHCEIEGRLVPRWFILESEAILDEVNRVRGEGGNAKMSMQHYRAKERLAHGHSDYSRKLALYCTELVIEDLEVWPEQKGKLKASYLTYLRRARSDGAELKPEVWLAS